MCLVLWRSGSCAVNGRACLRQNRAMFALEMKLVCSNVESEAGVMAASESCDV